MSADFTSTDLMALGTLGSTAAGIAGAYAAFESDRFKASIERRNARAALQAGQSTAERLARDRSRRLGRLRALAAAGGTTGGSILEVEADETAEAALDVATVRRNATLSAQGSRIAADAFRRRGEGRLIAGIGRSASTFLGDLNTINRAGGSNVLRVR